MPIDCKVCNKSFYDASSLTKHRRTHTGEKPYQCEICKKDFRQKRHLADHIKTTHKKERSFRCHFCGLFMAHRFSINRHLKRKHSNIYCPYCVDFDCGNMKGFRWHMEIAHPEHSPLTPPIIRIKQVPGVGTVSCITHTSTSTTGTVTKVSRITSPNGSVIVTETTTTTTSTGTSTTPTQLCPLQTTTVSQSSGESFSYAENAQGLGPIPSLNTIPSVQELLERDSPWLLDWEEMDNQ